ncbi:MAG: diacylglycerol kinase family lipid kinase [Clostridiaceae bacterium]|nr:diacylglycerol kinase family lipid kinase [Clostridiaceae bacterium]
MKHIFLINPAAGLQDSTERIRRDAAAEMKGFDYEILVTKGPGDATETVRRIAGEAGGEICRFYACGGDGTLSEVVNGAVGCENAEIACLPYGTGNDFIKIFDKTELFRSICAQVHGEAMPMDVLAVNDRYSINICNAGLDARICHWVVRNKRKCLFGGGFPYKLSLAINFFRKIDRRYRIEIDGEPLEADITLMIAANGRCYGGGFNAVPEADPEDGLLDILVIRKVSRPTFLRLLPDFAGGRHSELGDCQFYRRAKSLTLVSERPEPISCDGDIIVTDRAEIRLVRNALRFVVPEGVRLVRNPCSPASVPVEA